MEFYSILISLSHHRCLTGTNGPLAADARPCQPVPRVSGTGAADAPEVTAHLGDGGRSRSEEASRYSITSNPMLHGESWVTASVHSTDPEIGVLLTPLCVAAFVVMLGDTSSQGWSDESRTAAHLCRLPLSICPPYLHRGKWRTAGCTPARTRTS